MLYHDPDAQRFVLNLGDEPAYVAYRPARGSENSHEQVMDFHHVFVPSSHRGRGTAGRLLKFAFDHARAQGWKIHPTCPYIAGQFVPRFPEYQDILAT